MKRIFLIFPFLILSGESGFAILPGPIKDFYTSRAGDTTAIIFGTRELRPNFIKHMELLAYRNADFLKLKDPLRVVEVHADTAFPRELFARRSLVLMGMPKSNSFIAEWRSYFPFILRDSRFNLTGRKLYQGEDLTLSCIFPNPLAPDRYIMLLIGTEPGGQPSLSDWPGDYDYYVAQRHTFWGQYLNRGKFEKSSSLWSQELSVYERAPFDTTTLVALQYPQGMVWYPSLWEEDSVWEVPLTERVRLLEAIQNHMGFFERSLGVRVHGRVDFQLSDRYPQAFAHDPMGRVFIRTHPKQMDSSAFLSWGVPIVRVLFPCRDAALDWELFGHRYLLTQMHVKKPRGTGASRMDMWLKTLTNGDSTFLAFLTQLSNRGHAKKIGEALDSVTAMGKKYSFEMSEFVKVAARLSKDSVLQRFARIPLRSSPYEKTPTYELGLKNLGELFIKSEVMVGELQPKSRALAAGLRKGDKIVSVDGFPTVTNRSRAYLAWLEKKKGETLKLVIERKGVRRTLVIPIG